MDLMEFLSKDWVRSVLIYTVTVLRLTLRDSLKTNRLEGLRFTSISVVKRYPIRDMN